MSDINFFGETNFRNQRTKFGIKLDDRRRHFYVVGKTGMGKTEMLKNAAVQDIQCGNGMGFIDPHGEAVEELLNFVPEERVKDVIYFNPSDTKFPIAFNVMERVSKDQQHMVASGLMSVFKKIWPDVWSARMEYILNNVVLALLEHPDSTLLGINRMLSDPEYRQTVVNSVTDPVVKTFWLQEYARYTQRYEVEATAAIQNKVGQFIANPLIRNIVGQTHSNLDLRGIMDGEKILLANISKGRIGEDNSRLLGGLLITKLQLAAMSRVDIPEEERKDFFLYIDEFQNFATDSFVNILSEARKYRLCLILSHQYIAQLGTGTEATVRDAVFGNVGTLVSFRVGAEDAEWLEKEFTPEFLAEDFVNLGKYTIYVKLMIDGISSRPFSANTLAPPVPLKESQRESIIDWSRVQYGTPVEKVEKAISEWSGVDKLAKMPSAAPAQNQEQPVLYDVKCTNCGKDTKVVFEPDGKRPTYCKTCRKKLTQSKENDKEKQPAVKTSNAESKETEQSVSGSIEKVSSVENNVHEEEKDSEKRISLGDALQKRPVLFHPQKGAGKGTGNPKRKETNKAELKQVLQEALGKRKSQQMVREKEQEAEGILEPGQTVYFDR